MPLSNRHYQQLRDTVSYLFAPIQHDIVTYLFEFEYINSPKNREILERATDFNAAVTKAAYINQHFELMGSNQAIDPSQILEMWEREKKGLEFKRDNIERICRVLLDRIDFQLETTCDWIVAWLLTVRVQPHHQPEDFPILLSKMLLDANRKQLEVEIPPGAPHPAQLHREARTLFGLTDSATPEDIHSTYRDLCKRYHPDNGGSAEDFIQLQESYSVLISSAP